MVYARNKQQLISAESKGELGKLNCNELRAQTTSLLVVLFAAVTLFFTSANTKEAVNQQSIAALSAELSELKTEI